MPAARREGGGRTAGRGRDSRRSRPGGRAVPVHRDGSARFRAVSGFPDRPPRGTALLPYCRIRPPLRPDGATNSTASGTAGGASEKFSARARISRRAVLLWSAGTGPPLSATGGMSAGRAPQRRRGLSPTRREDPPTPCLPAVSRIACRAAAWPATTCHGADGGSRGAGRRAAKASRIPWRRRANNPPAPGQGNSAILFRTGRRARAAPPPCKGKPHCPRRAMARVADGRYALGIS